jgi:hypothetical protein
LFWDKLNLPHEHPKQVFGSPLTVIGFEVDPNLMQVTLPSHKKAELVVQLRCFAIKNHRWSLWDFQWLAGWCKWSFNVFPLLKPGLSMLYDKIRGKSNPLGVICINNALLFKIHWLANHIEASNGLYFFKSLDFDSTRDEVVVAYTDASGIGLGLWFPDDNFTCQCPLPSDSPRDTIFFHEALAVCSAIHTVVNMHEPPSKLLIYTDNSNTVSMFDSLRVKPLYNSLLLSAVDILINYNVDLHVEHIPGQQNVIADALSCFNNELVKDLVPDAQIFDFEPPQNVLGATKK